MSLAQHSAPKRTPSQLEAMADEVLLASSQDDPRFFEILVDRYQEAFLRAAQRVVRRREDAEDIVQEAFFKIYRNAHRFVKKENIEFKSWAYKVVLNTSFTHYQRLKKHGIREDPDGDEMLSSVVSDKDNLVEKVEMKLLIQKVLADLPDDLGAVLAKHYLEDKAYEVIAREDGVTIPSIKMRLWRARKAFKKLLETRDSSINKEENLPPHPESSEPLGWG
jgi:RNA polymerase sigma-70 factor (ECF subfamily)